MQKLRCTFNIMGLCVKAMQDATVQGNTNTIWCTWKLGIIIPFRTLQNDHLCHCFLLVFWMTERSKRTQRAVVYKVKTASLPINPADFNPAFVFVRSSFCSPGKIWRTALCMPVYYVIPITQQNPQCSAPHLPLIQRDENTYPHIAYRDEFVSPCTSRGEMNIMKIKYTKRQSSQSGGKGTWNFIMAKDKNGQRCIP